MRLWARSVLDALSPHNCPLRHSPGLVITGRWANALKRRSDPRSSGKANWLARQIAWRLACASRGRMELVLARCPRAKRSVSASACLLLPVGRARGSAIGVADLVDGAAFRYEPSRSAFATHPEPVGEIFRSRIAAAARPHGRHQCHTPGRWCQRAPPCASTRDDADGDVHCLQRCEGSVQTVGRPS